MNRNISRSWFLPKLLLQRALKVVRSQIPTPQHWMVLYEQLRFTALARRERTDATRDYNVAAEHDEAIGRIALQRPWVPIADCSLRRHFPDRQWIMDKDRHQFHTNGYMVIRNVLPENITGNAVREIAGFVGAELSDSSTWYGGAPQLDGIVPMHHAQSLWDIRQSPNLYQVFTEFFDNPRLIVDINRCIFRPPIHPGFPTLSHGTIHWDTDPRVPGPGSLQAVVLLTDVGRNDGGFQCLPDVYQNLQTWLQRYARRDDFDFFNPGLNNWKAKQIAGRAGDVILWSTKLPHGTATNSSNRPRIAAFVSMEPALSNEDLRESMKTWWLTKRAPDYWRGLPGQIDPEPGPPALLSELGQKLVGLIPW